MFVLTCIWVCVCVWLQIIYLTHIQNKTTVTVGCLFFFVNLVFSVKPTETIGFLKMEILMWEELNASVWSNLQCRRALVTDCVGPQHLHRIPPTSVTKGQKYVQKCCIRSWESTPLYRARRFYSSILWVVFCVFSRGWKGSIIFDLYSEKNSRALCLSSVKKKSHWQ